MTTTAAYHNEETDLSSGNDSFWKDEYEDYYATKIMSLVIIHKNRKLILRSLNIVYEVELNENGKAWLSILYDGDGLNCVFWYSQMYTIYYNDCFICKR